MARVVELVDTLDLKSSGHRGRTGSSPVPGTLKVKSPVSLDTGFFVGFESNWDNGTKFSQSFIKTVF